MKNEIAYVVICSSATARNTQGFVHAFRVTREKIKYRAAINEKKGFEKL